MNDPAPQTTLAAMLPDIHIGGAFHLLDHLPIGAIVLDSTFRVMHWNTCVEQWSGVYREEMLAQDIRKRFPQFGERRYSRRLDQVFYKGLSAIFCSQLHRYVIPCHLSGGVLRVQATTVTPLDAPDIAAKRGVRKKASAPKHQSSRTIKKASSLTDSTGQEQTDPTVSAAPYYALISIQDITDLTKQAQKYRNMRDRALREAEERSRVEAQVRMLNEQLERRVAERTLQVQEINRELTREIAEREQVEQALIESERLLSLVFDTVSVGLSVADSSGRYMRVNAAYLRIVGYKRPEDLIGKPFTLLYPPDEQAEAIQRLEMLLQSSERLEFQGERTIVTPQGMVDVFFATTKFANESGAQFIITALTDITLMKRAENEIRASLRKEQELNELKTHFVSLVSHEFRTPMTIILSSAELLQHSPTMNHERRTTLLKRIENSIQRMTELLEDVLHIEKTGREGIAFRPHEVHLADVCTRLIDEAVTAYSANRGTERRVHLRILGETQAGQAVMLDEQLLRYILLNLIVNAFKYSPNEAPVNFDVICTQTHLVFRVQDQGIGIPSEDMPKIFELFHRGQNAGNIYGTGLGLAIVKRSVDAHGGMIECDSTVGLGTTFTVSIPRVTATPSAWVEHKDNKPEVPISIANNSKAKKQTKKNL
jgi:PAS domain S-box-containing protein